MSNDNTIALSQRIPVLVPVFNALEYTKKAVETIKRNTHPNLYEVVFIDNASTDGTKDYLRQLVQDDPEHFRVITNEKNLGFAGGVNAGLQFISSFNWEYACIANNDLLFTPNWLVNLLECIQKSPFDNVGMVGPVSNAAGGSQGTNVKYDLNSLDRWAASYHQVMQKRWVEAGRLVGLCVLMSRKFFDTVGYFDERYVNGMWEDNDFCNRGRIAGFRYVVDHSTFLHHFMHKSFQENKLDSSHLFRTNKERYVAKWTGKDSIYERLAEQNAKLRGTPIVRDAEGRIKKFVVGACRVKDGADYIGKMLERASQVDDEIVILVSKLTKDNTKEICKKFPRVVLLEDDNDDQPGAKESDSRNRLLEMAYSRHPDWITVRDHDELPSKFYVENIDKLTNPENPEILCWVFPIIQLWNSENTRRMDGVWGNFWQGRMFRALPGLKIDNANNLIHSGAVPVFPQENMGMSLYKIIHYGNVDSSTRKKKYERYTKIDTDKDLNMVLGDQKDYYWQLYYGQPDPKEKAAFTGSWKVLPDPEGWSRPPYGRFFDRDAYRHVYDDLGIKLVPFNEDMTVSGVMLIHNEGDLVISCLNSLRPLVDEIICVDTGCVDATPEMAQQFGAQLFKFPWNNNFSDARNFSLSKASCDWILRVDPDEAIPFDTAFQIYGMVQQKNVDGFIFPIKNWLEQPNIGPNAKWALSETCRLFRNRYPDFKYTGLVHEELDDSFVRMRDLRRKELLDAGLTEAQADQRGPLINIQRSPLPLFHYGYLRGQRLLDQKFDYYCKLGNEQIKMDPKDCRPYFTTAVHYMHIGQYDKAIVNYHKVLELEPKHHMAWNDLGVCLWLQGRLDKAEECFRKAANSMDGTVHSFHQERVQKNLEQVKTLIISMTLF